MSLRLLRYVSVFFIVGKISPFYSGKELPFRDYKNSDLGCSVCRGSCYVRARFNNGQQVIFSLFAHCSMVNLRTNRKKNQGQFHLAKNPNQYHPTGCQSLESQSQNQKQMEILSPLHHRFHLFPTCSRFRLFFDSFSGFARGSFVVQLPFATPKTLVCAATKWKRTGQADLSICH